MIHYHGAPMWPLTAAAQFWPRRHGFVSFEHPEQIAMVAECCQSFALDNGAFSKWTAGKGEVDVGAYAAWVREWDTHPGFDFAIIPDTIDGSEFDNDRMIARWFNAGMRHGVAVWHLHESLERLSYLVHCTSVTRGRLALGSSGQWATPATPEWWQRMEQIRPIVCDENGRPRCKLHGLRMLNPTIFSHVPLASADSCNVAMNIGKDTRWKGTYQPVTETQRALILAERIEMHVAAVRWSHRVGVQQNLELIG
jgi:hypothetical protein